LEFSKTDQFWGKSLTAATQHVHYAWLIVSSRKTPDYTYLPVLYFKYDITDWRVKSGSPRKKCHYRCREYIVADIPWFLPYLPSILFRTHSERIPWLSTRWKRATIGGRAKSFVQRSTVPVLLNLSFLCQTPIIFNIGTPVRPFHKNKLHFYDFNSSSYVLCVEGLRSKLNILNIHPICFYK